MVYALLISLLLAGTAAAQAVAGPTSERFLSEKGRFSIALPATPEFEELAADPEAPKATGGKYIWSLPEGVVTVDYTDDPDSVIKTRKDYADMQEGMVGGIGVLNGKIISKKPYYVGKSRGYQLMFVDKDKMQGFTRMLIVGERKYLLFGLARTEVKGSKVFIARALDSFKLTQSK